MRTFHEHFPIGVDFIRGNIAIHCPVEFRRLVVLPNRNIFTRRFAAFQRFLLHSHKRPKRDFLRIKLVRIFFAAAFLEREQVAQSMIARVVDERFIRS